ncbi:hypothetical protein DL98DRAFT_519749 [Cadophora sp. DSE1049]|nr:hypothetical protein DL98DRAFT_519749 [Cadophora sp. DSE1049]
MVNNAVCIASAFLPRPLHQALLLPQIPMHIGKKKRQDSNTIQKVVVPVAVLASIGVCMFIFMCWWFPRAWAKGDASDRAEFDEAKRQRELAEGTAVGSGGETDVELGDLGGNRTAGRAVPQMPARYVPPVTPY